MTIQYEPQTAQAFVPADRYGPQVDLTFGEQVSQALNHFVKENKYNSAQGDVILSNGKMVTLRLDWKITARGYHLEQRKMDLHDGRGMVYYPSPTYLDKNFWENT